ncbi:hypothetical protein [Pontibacter fetidus]|uniref:Uncharacterized protein n=1 Tax=Pontibacter fetidus TaxID=2700082 RepID=A0A6B2H271_9BACT|nr:hypothetical protein [Pontibacter fetidus]NDK57369.1 hypothetical protein [Pontibacter fetidus]
MKTYDLAHIFESNVPFYGTMEDYEKLNEVVGHAKRKIDSSDSPRELIFESWFLFDYLIRKLLLKAFNIENYETEEFDPMYDYLPQSFDSCLKSLESLLKQQRRVYQQQLHPNTVRTYPIFTMPGSFFLYLHDKDPNLVTQFIDNLRDYELLYEAEYQGLKEKFKNEDYECDSVSRRWYDTCQNIDANWFKSIRKLNKTRNRAAHVVDAEKIYSSFGINGANKLIKLKAELIKLLDEAFFFNG